MTKKIICSDGAWGTELMAKGLKPGECPELWCLEKPDIVKGIVKSYIDAGSDIIKTNSFGGSRFKLAMYGLESRASEINEAAARLSKESAGGRKVMASIGPTGKLLLMEDVTEEELYEAYKTQAIALEKGGADALCFETMMDVPEAVIGIKAAKENTGLEVYCTFTFSPVKTGGYRTMMGETPTSACKAAAAAGADIVGTNCGGNIWQMVGITKEIRAALPNTPIMVHANADPDETPDMMAAGVKDLFAAGAYIIGGCCGTTPEHIRRIKHIMEEINQ